MSDDLYRDITDFAHDSPGWAHTLAEYGTEGGLLLLIGLLATACWRTVRREGVRGARGVRGVHVTHGTASALLAFGGLVCAYGISELTKVLVEEERPCRAVRDAAAPLVSCPESGDWSFPSNHATLALAAATGVVLLWRAMAWLALPVALLTAFSRVFIGVHYPHDVLVGGLLGAGVVVLAVQGPVRRVFAGQPAASGAGLAPPQARDASRDGGSPSY